MWAKMWGEWFQVFPHVPLPPAVPNTMPAPNVSPGENRLTVSWMVGSISRGSIVGYDVRLGTGTPVRTGASPRSHTFTGLTGGQAYTATVRAVSDQGEVGAWSPGRNGTPTSPPPPAWNGRLPLPAGSRTEDFTDDYGKRSDFANAQVPLAPLGSGGVLRLQEYTTEWDTGPDDDMWGWLQAYDGGVGWVERETWFYPDGAYWPFVVGTQFFVWNDGPGWMSWAEPVQANEGLVQSWDTNGLESPGQWGEDAIVIPPHHYVQLQVLTGGTVRVVAIEQGG